MPIQTFNLFFAIFSGWLAVSCLSRGQYGLAALNAGASLLNVAVVAAWLAK